MKIVRTVREVTDTVTGKTEVFVTIEHGDEVKKQYSLGIPVWLAKGVMTIPLPAGSPGRIVELRDPLYHKKLWITVKFDGLEKPIDVCRDMITDSDPNSLACRLAIDPLTAETSPSGASL